MSLEFPTNNDLCPDFIHIESLGSYGVLTTITDVGVEKRVTEETNSVGMIIRGEFTVLTQLQLNTLINFFWQVKGTNGVFDLTDQFFSVCEVLIEDRIRTIQGDNLWRFLEAPQIENKYSNISSAIIRLISVKDEPASWTSITADPPSWSKKLPEAYGSSPPSGETPAIVDRSISLPPIIQNLVLKNTPIVNLSAPTTVEHPERFVSLIFPPTLKLGFTDLAIDSEVVMTFDPPAELVIEIGTVSYGESLYLEDTPEIIISVSDTYGPSDLGGEFAIINSNTNANIKTTYMVDTNSNTVTLTLPTASDEDWIRVIDFSGSDSASPTGFGLNTCFLVPSGGDTIQGYASIDLDIENVGVYLIYATNGWKVASTI